MFANKLTKGGKALILSLAILSPAETAMAETTKLSIELTGLQASDGKLYISIQTEDEFMQNRGTSGGIYTIESAGTQTYFFSVPEGLYAISIWHDTDNNGQFSLDKNWMPTDGWGASGTPSKERRPTFDEAKISISKQEKNVSIPMIYTQ